MKEAALHKLASWLIFSAYPLLFAGWFFIAHGHVNLGAAMVCLAAVLAGFGMATSMASTEARYRDLLDEYRDCDENAKHN